MRNKAYRLMETMDIDTGGDTYTIFEYGIDGKTKTVFVCRKKIEAELKLQELIISDNGKNYHNCMEWKKI